MNKHEIIIIGGGTGGIMAAAQLQRKSKKKLDIAIVEPSETHVYQPAYTLVGAGTFSLEKTKRPEARYIPRNVTWIKDKAISVDPTKNEVITEVNGAYTYEYLVLAPGLTFDLSLVEGLDGNIGKNDICSNYIDPEYTWKTVQNFKGGTALFTQAATPIKCGGAPQKAMYMSEDHFRKNKALRDKTNVAYIMPGSVIFGTPEFRNRLEQIVDDRDLILKYFHQLFKVDAEQKIAYYRIADGKNYEDLTRNDPDNRIQAKFENNVVEVPFDMMHLAPPHVPPKFLRESAVSIQEGGMKGYGNVNKHTLQHNEYKNVFGVGDAMGIPAAKTGAAIRKQVPVMVDHILAQIENRQSEASYNGYSSCPIVTGYGKMLLCEFDYDNNRDSDPILSKIFDTTKDSYPMWILKKIGLPYLYWNQMLKGKM